MNLLAPLLAAFTVATVIPVLIHLLNKSRHRTVAWGAMEFLRKALQENRRRLQLRDWILMVLRASAIGLAALALARPTLSGLALLPGGERPATVVILDASLSMSALDADHGTRSRLDAARERARIAVQDAGRIGSCALVVLADTAASELTRPTRDLAFVTGAIDRTQVADGGTSIRAGLAKAKDLLDKSAGPHRIVLVTDLQASGWGEASDPAWRQLTEELTRTGVQLVLVDVGQGAPDHLGLDRVAFEDDLVTAGDISTLVATVRNYGARPATNVPVDLLVGTGPDPEQPQRQVAGTVLPALAPGATAQVRIPYRFTAAGIHRVSVRLPADAVPGDRLRHLAVNVLDRLPVLVIEPAPTAATPPGTWTAGDYLRAALMPAGDGDPTAEGRPGGIAVTRITPAELAGTGLERYRAVILADLPVPTDALADALAARVKAGMGLILLPGSQSDRTAWQKTLGDRVHLLPATLGPVRDHAGEGLALATDHLEHPIVAFFAADDRRAFWAAPRYRRSFALTVEAPAATAAPTTHLVARFADGSPALVERTFPGGGSVLLSAAPVDRAWTDLPLRPAFVMALTRAVQHVALGQDLRQEHRTGEPLATAVPARLARARLRLRLPDGTVTPITPVPAGDGGLRADVPDTGRSGFYRLWADNPASELALQAVNTPPAESDLTPLTLAQVQERLGAVPVRVIAAEDDMAAGIRRTSAGRELWPWLFGVALACLLTEMFLAQHWAPRSAARNTP